MLQQYANLIPRADSMDMPSTLSGSASESASKSSLSEEDEYDPFYYPLSLSLYDPDAASSLVSLQSTEGFDEYQDYLLSFSEFLQNLSLQFFEPKEFLFLGGSHNAPGPCSGRNALPPRSIWQNVRGLAKALDELRRVLGAPVTPISVYRNKSYNRCVGGVEDSFHGEFRAADFVCHDGRGSAHWAAVARSLRDDGVFAGGVGIYKTFVHVDTRGSNADWDNR